MNCIFRNTSYKRNMVSVPRPSSEVLKHIMFQAGYKLKYAMAVANNVPMSTMLESIDKIRECGLYKHQTKKMLKDVTNEYSNYMRDIRHSKHTAYLFNVSDICSEHKRYFRSGMTNDEYFDLWDDMGAFAYKRYRPMVVMLRFKYKVSIENHKVKNGDLYSYLLTTLLTFMIAKKYYSAIRSNICKEYNIESQEFDMRFSPFNIERVERAWRGIAKHLIGTERKYELDNFEMSNLQLAIEQLEEKISDDINNNYSVRDAFENNEELFATKGMHKKVMREIGNNSYFHVEIDSYQVNNKAMEE